MGQSCSFQFLDGPLHEELIGLLKKAEIGYSIAKDGAALYSQNDEEFVENELICSIRDKVFPSWQVLTCPKDWIARYKHYMSRHGVPFREERSNGETWFLIPGGRRPHLWKLLGVTKTGRLEPQRSR